MLSFSFPGFHSIRAATQDLQKTISFSGCQCKDLECDCCAAVNLTSTSHRDRKDFFNLILIFIKIYIGY